MSASPYLTVREAASELGITDDGVRKLIARGKLPAIKRSERNTLIPRPAFESYVRRINGQSIPPGERLRAQRDLVTRLAEFERDAGKTPQQWLTDWASAGPELDTAENMALAVSAVGLVAEQRAAGAQDPGQSAPVRLTSV
jgi:excisionase family DNA binding protein